MRESEHEGEQKEKKEWYNERLSERTARWAPIIHFLGLGL